MPVPRHQEHAGRRGVGLRQAGQLLLEALVAKIEGQRGRVVAKQPADLGNLVRPGFAYGKRLIHRGKIAGRRGAGIGKY